MKGYTEKLGFWLSIFDLENDPEKFLKEQLIGWSNPDMKLLHFLQVIINKIDPLFLQLNKSSHIFKRNSASISSNITCTVHEYEIGRFGRSQHFTKKKEKTKCSSEFRIFCQSGTKERIGGS